VFIVVLKNPFLINIGVIRQLAILFQKNNETDKLGPIVKLVSFLEVILKQDIRQRLKSNLKRFYQYLRKNWMVNINLRVTRFNGAISIQEVSWKSMIDRILTKFMDKKVAFKEKWQHKLKAKRNTFSTKNAIYNSHTSAWEWQK
jgi:hypothetical protein